MENQIQALELVNGEWVSRPQDIYHILGRSRQQPHTAMQEPEPKLPNEVPQLGLLSRTLLPSPVVKFILPAKIRQKSLHDAVFISEDSVHLHDMSEFGRLRYLASKRDLRARILCAKVFGEPRTLDHHPEYGRLQSPKPDRRGGALPEAEVLPPQVVLLTLDSKMLMFVWAESSLANNVRFHQRAIRLPSGRGYLDQLGTHLAIDPKCRAVAVAAREGRFMVYKTKNMDQWREDLRAGRDVTPIVDERLISIDGIIMHMEFLSSGSNGLDDHHIILLFVIQHRGQTKLTCFDWDAREGLDKVSPAVEREVIDQYLEGRVPSLLVPLRHRPDFLLITDTIIFEFRNALAGASQPIARQIDCNILKVRRPGDSKQQPIWTQWDRVPRNAEYVKESFYIAREDGTVMFAESDPAGMQTSEAGILPFPIDKAFASLDAEDIPLTGLRNPDVLAAAGVTSDGHLVKVGAWMGHYRSGVALDKINEFEVLDKLPSWAPMNDFILPNSSLTPARQGNYKHPILFANGRAPHGALSSLRWGLSAEVQDNVDLSLDGVTGLWVLDEGYSASEPVASPGPKDNFHYENHVVLLVSRPPDNYVIRLSRVKRYDFEPTELSREDDGVNRDEETISACMLDGAALQVTRTTVRMLRRPDLVEIDSIPVPFGSSILAAATQSDIPFLAFALREMASTVLSIVPFVKAEQGFAFAEERRSSLPSEPSCVELLRLGSHMYVFVGTSNSSCLLYRISEGGLQLVWEGRVGYRDAASGSSVCESVVALTTPEGQQTLLCGMRDGDLVSVACSMATNSQDRLRVTTKGVAKMGDTVARVTKSATDPSAAFVICGDYTCWVRYDANKPARLDINPIWFTDQIGPGTQQLPVSALEQLPSYVEDDRLSGYLFAASGRSVLIAQWDYGGSGSRRLGDPGPCRAVPKRLGVEGTPTKLLYAEKLHKIVLACTDTREVRPPPNGYRRARGFIRLLDPDSKTLDDNERHAGVKVQEGEESPIPTTHDNAVFQLEHYEKVHCLLEWTYVDERQRHYHFVVVGTEITEGENRRTGRRIFLQVAQRDGKELKLQKTTSYNAPVRSMAFFSDRELVSVVGSQLRLDEYCREDERPRWIARAETTLTSPGVHVTVNAPFIYVSTEEDSHVCYQVRNDPCEPPKKVFERVFTSDGARFSTQHLVLQIPPLDSLSESGSVSMQVSEKPSTIVLLAHKGASLVGISQPSSRLTKSTAPVIFEAVLNNRSVTRLQRGNIRPPWRLAANNAASYLARNGSSSRESLKPSIPGVLVDDVLGATSDGTLYGFSILTPAALKLLKLLENLIKLKRKRDPALQPSILPQYDVSMGDDADIRIEARAVDPTMLQLRYRGIGKTWAVDGDIITQYLEDMANLKELIYRDTEPDVVRLFAKLAGDVFKDVDAGMVGTDEGDAAGEKLVGMVVEWVGAVIGPVF